MLQVLWCQGRWATHLTFAATDEIASFFRFFLLDTAVPMLAWKQRWRENGSFQTPAHGGMHVGGKRDAAVTNERKEVPQDDISVRQ